MKGVYYEIVFGKVINTAMVHNQIKEQIKLYLGTNIFGMKKERQRLVFNYISS